MQIYFPKKNFLSLFPFSISTIDLYNKNKNDNITSCCSSCRGSDSSGTIFPVHLRTQLSLTRYGYRMRNSISCYPCDMDNLYNDDADETERNLKNVKTSMMSEGYQVGLNKCTNATVKREKQLRTL